MKKTVWLLDADMTLFDFEKAEHFALREACARFGIEISVKESALYHEINEALWQARAGRNHAGGAADPAL